MTAEVVVIESLERALDELGYFVSTSGELAAAVHLAFGDETAPIDANALDDVRKLLVQAARLVAEVKTRRRTPPAGGEGETSG